MTNEIVKLNVELIAQSVFQVPDSRRAQYPVHGDRDLSEHVTVDATANMKIPGFEWTTAVALCNGEDLAEFAGRACYESWDRPNAKTATNAGYLAHILEVGHESVLEHASLTYYITGVSRSLTHELVRHRHFSYSQISQRYVDVADAGIVVPPEMRGSYDAEKYLKSHMAQCVREYQGHVHFMTAGLEDQGVKGTDARKRARQAARCVMPNMTETRIVVTGNIRAWREMVALRGTPAADVEIRELAVAVLRNMQEVIPNMVQDMHIVVRDGVEGIEVST